MVAIASQSGGMAVALGAALRLRGFASTYIVSTGNEAALGLEEVIADAIEHEASKVIAMVAEQIPEAAAVPRIGTARAGGEESRSC